MNCKYMYLNTPKDIFEKGYIRRNYFVQGKKPKTLQAQQFLVETDRGYPTKKARQSWKEELVFMKGNLCPWREKEGIFDWNC